MVMDIMDQARQIERSGKRVIHLEVGQPSAGASQEAINAVINSINHHPLGYTVSLGLPELREGVSLLYKKWYNLKIDPSRVIITSGSSAAFILAFSSLFDEGERVGVTEPGYPSYRQILKSLSLRPVGLPTSKKSGHIPNLSETMVDLSIIHI